MNPVRWRRGAAPSLVVPSAAPGDVRDHLRAYLREDLSPRVHLMVDDRGAIWEHEDIDVLRRFIHGRNVRIEHDHREPGT